MLVYHRARVVLLVFSLCGSLPNALSFYLPGLAPVSFCEKDASGKDIEVPDCKSTIELFVNRLDSVESVLPYEYTAFDFCADQPEKRPSENLGQVLFGERIEPSPYKFFFKKNEDCKKVCIKTYNTEKSEDKARLDFLKKGMLLNYQHHWYGCPQICEDSTSPFVFICSSPQELVVKFPMKGKHKIWKLESQIHQSAKKCLMQPA